MREEIGNRRGVGSPSVMMMRLALVATKGGGKGRDVVSYPVVARWGL